MKRRLSSAAPASTAAPAANNAISSSPAFTARNRLNTIALVYHRSTAARPQAIARRRFFSESTNLRDISPWSSLAFLILASAAALSAAAGTPPEKQPEKPRARDLGVPFDGTPGPLNAITDVAGVTVGHTTLISGS